MRSPHSWLLLLAGLVLFAGCSDDSILIAAPNNAPQIAITEPLYEEGQEPIEVEEELGLSVLVQVDDAEDLENQLMVTWGAIRTDDSGVEHDLGSLNPDPTGWAALHVIGLTGGNWRLWVRVTDTDGATDEVALLLFVFPANSPPVATEVLLGPEPAYEGTELVCQGIGWNDVDGDDAGWMAAWFVDGDPVTGQIGLSLDGDDFDKHQQVMCELTPFDGELLGQPLQSNIVTILNSAPEPPSLDVEPQPHAEVDQAIACSVDQEATDADGDVIILPDDYLVSWLLDGVAVPELDGAWEVPAEMTQLGEEWTCEVIATDGSDASEVALASTVVLPADGDLVITEVMARPGAVSDAAGEWFELYNASGRDTSLLGFELYDDDGGSHTIGADVVVGPGERLVLGRNADATSNGGVTVDYEYSGIALDDIQGLVGLRFEGVEIDEVNYNLAPHAAWSLGRSFGLDPDLAGPPSAILNDEPGNWCMAGDLLGSYGSDFASPGAENGSCDCLLSDDDGDGWGDENCVEPDCDDLEPLSFPGNLEVCDAIDNDCVDGVDDLFDEDGDGVSSCGPDGLVGTTDDDCDDDPVTGASTYPGNVEVCDGIDNDCVAGPDDGFDVDGDGVLTCGPDLIAGNADDDCDDLEPLALAGNGEVCDAIYNDCVGGVDDGFDDDGDGVTRCGPDGIYSNADDDCNDVPGNNGASIFPGNSELCDGIDNDCDSVSDEDFDLDGDGVTTCGPDHNFATSWDNDCDDGNAQRNPNLPEVCDPIDLDEDCDGTGDEPGAINCVAYYTDADNDTWGVGSSQCLCSPSGWLRATRSGDCFDSNGYARPQQGSWFPAHRGDNNWDYNCDGQQTKRWNQIAGSCEWLFGCSNPPEGWAGSAPSCGSTVTWRANCGCTNDTIFGCIGCGWKGSFSRTQECH